MTTVNFFLHKLLIVTLLPYIFYGLSMILMLILYVNIKVFTKGRPEGKKWSVFAMIMCLISIGTLVERIIHYWNLK